MNIPVYIKAAAGALLGLLIWQISEKHSRHVALKRSIEPVEQSHGALLAIVSVLTGAVCATAAPLDLNYIYIFLVYLILHSISITDFRYRRIPNSSILAILAVWLLSGAAGLAGIGGFNAPDILGSLSGSVLCLLLFLLPSLTGKKIGFGDVKLAGALGLLLGIYGGLACIALSGILVLAYICARYVLIPGSMADSFLQHLKEQIPMGPPLCVSAMLVLIAGYILPPGMTMVSRI